MVHGSIGSPPDKAVTPSILIRSRHEPKFTRPRDAPRGAVGNRIGSYLRRVNADNLYDSSARTAFLRHAPAIVQKLALTDPVGVDFFTADHLHVDLEYLAVPLALTLNQRGRTAMTVLTEIIGCPLVDALRSGVHALVGAVAEQARGSIEGVDLPNGPVNAEEPQCDDLDLTIDEIDFSRDTTS
ncbi:hypothetical protein AB0C50_22200 [Micromonospora taraxaci]|uniref:hypothetical protein n=1 Tax=Micromonospora taraxaci TaxID=1316803 RepID=UPI00340E7479